MVNNFYLSLLCFIIFFQFFVYLNTSIQKRAPRLNSLQKQKHRGSHRRKKRKKKKMEIVIPNMEFDFNSARSSPQPSAPSSPKRFGQYYYTSAPTSPSRISEFYKDFDNLYVTDNNDGDSSSSQMAVPFGREEKRPGTPRSPKAADEFAFNFSSDMKQAPLTTADELFDGGRIRPLKQPLLSSSPRSSKSANPFSQGKKIVRDVFSPRNKKKADLFPVGVENSEKKIEQERGRTRRNDLSSGSRRASRSLSPYRVSEYPWEEEEKQYQQRQQQQQPNKQPSPLNSKLPPPHPPPPSSSSSSSSSSSTKSSSRKWRFTDFLLFRSASEGRAADKDPLRKYSGFKKNERSTEGSGSGRRKGPVSAHELHYTKNKAASQDLKKKTFLPYKSGILGFHGFTRS